MVQVTYRANAPFFERERKAFTIRNVVFLLRLSLFCRFKRSS